ncbi:isopentenyl-diphosphate Delta-isomerase [Rhodococcus sp. ABRD24]|nr:isopentenyl-diphosphate Delta-isomerase [Rhodococcus sp. ABRD24]QBJ98862.1 isopentenyl-diphosphate Delta-isomerase [Rhodococcus sp. ABRD24]
MVILLDDSGIPIGKAPKAAVHTENTPLHRAFSCHVFAPDGRLLVTRRALTKLTWPGVWTNSFCGHPLPDESDHDAITRRGQWELGITLTDIRPLLPMYRYRAVDSSGIVENEICPVYAATTADEPTANPAEVQEWSWVSASDIAAATHCAPFAFSPWFVEQISQIELYGTGSRSVPPKMAQ